MTARYIIRHHPGLYTSLCIEVHGQPEREIESRYTWAVARDYARSGYASRGLVSVTFDKPAPYVEIGPWVTF